MKTIGVIVTDKDSGSGLGSTSVTVNNVAPINGTITATPNVIPKGSTSTVRLNFTDAGTKDTHTCTFNWDSAAVAVVETNGNGYCESEFAICPLRFAGLAVVPLLRDRDRSDVNLNRQKVYFAIAVADCFRPDAHVAH